jgi:hypothetical protein
MGRGPSFAPPAGDLSIATIAPVEVAPAATAGQGVALEGNGLLPQNIVAPTPTADYVLAWNGTTKQREWRLLTSASITPGTFARTVGYGTSLPVSPSDGDEYVLVDSTTLPTYQWRLRFNSGSSNTNKWEFVGGAPALIEVTTGEATNTTDTYQALTTPGPSFTIPRAGVYSVGVGMRASAASGRGGVRMSYDIGGTGAVDADAAWNTQGDFALVSSVGHERIKSAIAATTALVAKYRPGAAVAATISDRWMRVTPVRVS